MTTAFEAAKVTITRKRFSTTQGEVLVEYDGVRIEQYGDKIELRDGVWAGYDDAVWLAAAKREAIARGLATEPTPPAPAAKFEAGKTYWTRSACDSDCIIRVAVASRTAKTIVTTAGKRLRVSEYNGAEQVKPWGSYSMAPVVGAGKVEAQAEPAQ